VVVPFTADGRLVEQFAAELSPELMPRPGNAAGDAIALAAQLLQQAELAGSVLLITDAITPDAVAALPKSFRTGILAMAAPPGSPAPARGPPAPALDRQALAAAASALGGSLVEVSVDDSDVRRLAHRLDRQLSREATEESERWRDAGYYLLFPLALIVLLWFRRGWAVQWQG
jgi:Ca-activated chloride channel family protein